MDEEESLKIRQEWLEKIKKEGKLKDSAKDNRIILTALQNPARREMIKFIGISNKKSLEEVKERFKPDLIQAELNLNILEKALFIKKVEEDGVFFYTITPFGEAYL